jgi:hypothetical protein
MTLAAVHVHRTHEIRQLNYTKHLFKVVTETDDPKWRKTAEGHEKPRHLKDNCTLLGMYYDCTLPTDFHL